MQQVQSACFLPDQQMSKLVSDSFGGFVCGSTRLLQYPQMPCTLCIALSFSAFSRTTLYTMLVGVHSRWTSSAISCRCLYLLSVVGGTQMPHSRQTQPVACIVVELVAWCVTQCGSFPNLSLSPSFFIPLWHATSYTPDHVFAQVGPTQKRLYR